MRKDKQRSSGSPRTSEEHGRTRDRTNGLASGRMLERAPRLGAIPMAPDGRPLSWRPHLDAHAPRDGAALMSRHDNGATDVGCGTDLETAFQVFESAWLIALPAERFCNLEPYKLLHPDDQRIVDRVFRATAGLFPVVSYFITAKAEARPMGLSDPTERAAEQTAAAPGAPAPTAPAPAHMEEDPQLEPEKGQPLAVQLPGQPLALQAPSDGNCHTTNTRGWSPHNHVGD